MTSITHATSSTLQFSVDGVDRPQGNRFTNVAKLEAHLANWVEAAPARIPFERRTEAAEAILICWQKKRESLCLAEMQLSTLPDAVFEMDHLHLLNLSDNQLTELPDAVRGLTNLKTLNLSRNPLRRLPERLPALAGLILYEVDLKQYPDNRFDLPVDCMIYRGDKGLDKTEKEGLSNQMADHLHGPIVDRRGPPRGNPGNAANLGRTSSNKEAHVPASTVIGFNWDSPNSPNSATTLGPTDPGAAPDMATPGTSSPADIGHPRRQRDSSTTREALWPTHGGDTAEETSHSPIAHGSGADTRLRGYGVDRGLCRDLRNWIYLVDDPEIQRKRRLAAGAIQRCIDNTHTQLNLGDLGLTDLPAVLWTQTQITQLHLGGNQLSVEALSDIGKLTNLSHLFLPSNGLSRLPQHVATLSKLRVVDLSNNSFVGLPPQIAGLSELKQLYLNKNLILHHQENILAPTDCQVEY